MPSCGVGHTVAMDDRGGAAGAAGFANGVAPWRERLGTVRDAVRQALVARQLAAHLPPPLRADGSRTRVLDAGCGQGTQLMNLARAGYQVVGLDQSSDLLALAESAAAAEPDDVRARVEIVAGDVLDLRAAATAGIVADGFDAVCCHGVVMYLPSLDAAVAELAGVLRPGGVLSVLSRNRAGIAMRAGMTGDWRGAIDGFDATRYGNRLGIANCRADDPVDVAGAFVAAGVEVDAWYGVRLFSDHFGDVPPPEDPDELAALLAAEEAAAARDPYRQLAALTHTLGTRR